MAKIINLLDHQGGFHKEVEEAGKILNLLLEDDLELAFRMLPEKAPDGRSVEKLEGSFSIERDGKYFRIRNNSNVVLNEGTEYKKQSINSALLNKWIKWVGEPVMKDVAYKITDLYKIAANNGSFSNGQCRDILIEIIKKAWPE